MTRPNGINTNYGYDNLSRLLSVLHQAGATTLDGASYTYDNAGNRTSKMNHLNSVTENYMYDAIYQLTQVLQGANTTEAYTYDLVGNRLSTVSDSGWTYNSSNQLTSRPGFTYTYDNNGGWPRQLLIHKDRWATLTHHHRRGCPILCQSDQGGLKKVGSRFGRLSAPGR